MMRRLYIRRQHQRGAIAIMFAFSLIVLFGIMGLALDLGRLYVVRTELQNAADAAALAGALALDQTQPGVIKARDAAKAIGLQHKTKFSFGGNAGIAIADENIYVGRCPKDTNCDWTRVNNITSTTAPGKTFLKVDIPSGPLYTFFMRIVPAIASGTTMAANTTFGMAVAGYFVQEITPIGVCAIDLLKGGTRDLTPPDPAGRKELTEFGYRRGIAYDLMELGNLGATSTPYLLNPVDAWTPAGSPCENNHSNAPYAKDFVCTGTSAVIRYQPGIPAAEGYEYGFAYGSTGFSWGPVRDALNSRFDLSACAPQDANNREYEFDLGVGGPRAWTQPAGNTLPSQQSITINPLTNTPVAAPTINDYGTLWSYSRAMIAVGTSPNATAGTPFGTDDWSALYGSGLAADTSSGYLSNAVRPYDTSRNNTGGVPERRVLNVAIVDCAAASGNNCSSKIPIVGIGKFFMQTRAENPKSIYGEFSGLVEPIPVDEIKLYR